ncbi:SDR family oxidoreductase [Algirhabdus cladophorae]|uniref:SDR family oxidoreductase n=1 Tax=Algirhabdus cladophorae TaxID=3377108 RepID=UPI003B846B87
MNTALVIGASGGIGQAVGLELERRGASVTRLSRRVDGFDLGNEASVKAALSSLEGPFDVIFVATGALTVGAYEPEKSLSAISAAGMADQFAVNAIGPALILKHARHLIPKTDRCVFAILSARVGSIGDNTIGGWTGYRAAKAALNQIVRSASIELGRTHKGCICAALHPGTVETPFTAKYAGRHKTVPAEVAAGNLISVIDAFTLEHTGGFFDYAGEAVPW